MADSGDVIFEFVRLGQTVKVSVVDVATSTEISIMGPAASGEAALRKVALRKLEYVLRRRGPGNKEQ